MKILVLKMSSMGDLIHTLPAIQDIYSRFPDVSFDWVVEESFAEIPAWHPAVKKAIPIALRRWRKNWLKAMFSGEIFSFIKILRAEKYDLVIDAQGLIKSALVARLAKASNIYGPDKKSARESAASFLYSQKISVPKKMHAITRTRLLFSQIFNYELDPAGLNLPEYGLEIPKKNKGDTTPFVLFLHGTTWETKHWPEEYWMALGKKIMTHGWNIYLPWGSQAEKDRADRIAKKLMNIGSSKAIVLERLKLTQLAQLLMQATYVVGVDSGLSHLAAALNCKAITVFGPTDSLLTGPLGKNQITLQSSFGCSPCFLKKCSYPLPHKVSPPCFGLLPPEKIWAEIKKSV